MDNKTIRLRNVQLLSLEFGGTSKLAERLERQMSQISQWLGGKNIGDKIARDIEEKLGKPLGWLDQPQFLKPGVTLEQFEEGQRGAYSGDNIAEGLGQYQPQRLDPVKVASTTQALITFLGRRGLTYDPVADAELFVEALYEYELLPDEPTQEQGWDFASKVVSLIDAREARRNERKQREGRPAGGALGVKGG